MTGMTCVLESLPGAARRDSATAETARRHGATKFPNIITGRGGQSSTDGGGPVRLLVGGQIPRAAGGAFHRSDVPRVPFPSARARRGNFSQISSQSATLRGRAEAWHLSHAFSRIGRDSFLQPAGVRREWFPGVVSAREAFSSFFLASFRPGWLREIFDQRRDLRP